MLGYREGGNTLEENTTRSSVKSCSVASKTGASKHLPVHDLIQEELERRAVKTLSNSHTRLPIHLVSAFYTTFNPKKIRFIFRVFMWMKTEIMRLARSTRTLRLMYRDIKNKTGGWRILYETFSSFLDADT